VKAQYTKLRADGKNGIPLNMTFCCDTYAAEWKHKPSVVTNFLSDFIVCYMFQHLENHHQAMKNIYKER
jgi:hypothetical protein